MSNITNLKEFITLLGGDTPYKVGRAIYKTTNCGLWTAYLVEKTSKRDTILRVSVRLKNEKLHASVEESVFDYENEQAPNALSLLGFNADGSPRRGDKIGRTLDAYRRVVENFLKKDRFNGVTNTIGDTRNPYKLTLHPPHQHELGMGRGCKQVWITLHRTEEPSYREVYYESDEANTLSECAGIQLGSIVEGCDACVNRDPLLFPFTEGEFNDYVQGIDNEAAEWEREKEEERFEGWDAALSKILDNQPNQTQ